MKRSMQFTHLCLDGRPNLPNLPLPVEGEEAIEPMSPQKPGLAFQQNARPYIRESLHNLMLFLSDMRARSLG